MTAAIMMVTFNRLELTKQTIKCIFENTYYLFNLCIVDNGSDDGTTEWLDGELQDMVNRDDNECQRLLVTKNKENRGIAIGRNQALVLANKTMSKWLVTLDNDVWVPKEWLCNCVEVLQANRQYGSIGVNMENVVYPMVEKGGKTFQSKPQGNLGTACTVFDRSLHKLLGFFNYSGYKFYAHEDADWGMRTRAVGLKLGYIQEMGKHIGEGENDVGEYREFKNKWHKENLPKFHDNARGYMTRQKPVYIAFEDVG